MDGKIAVEEHFLPEGSHPALLGVPDVHERRDIEERLRDVGERRLLEMDAAGIEMAVLSLAAPGIQDEANIGEAVRKAAAANDRLAEIVNTSQGRYAGLAAIPFQSPKAACAELERAIRELGMKGVLANGYSTTQDGADSSYYDEPVYLTFWECVAHLGVPFYLHPRDPLPGQRRIYRGREELLGATWAFAIETATHALRLITSGLFDRFPNLTLILGHMGELLPFAVDRAQRRLSHNPLVHLDKSLPEYLQTNFYLTTSGNLHDVSLRGCLEQVGPDRILFAVDYPFEKMNEAASWLERAHIDPTVRHKIAHANAKELLHLNRADRTR